MYFRFSWMASCLYIIYWLANGDRTKGSYTQSDSSGGSTDCHVCSCSICVKKQNRHFIVPHNRFKLLQVRAVCNTFKSSSNLS